MQKIHSTAFDPASGQARAGASVAVYLTGTVTFASLFQDDEVTPKANPLTADSAGRVSFKVVDGEYDLTVSGAGFTTFTYSKVQVADKDNYSLIGHTHAFAIHTHEDSTQGGQLNATNIFSAGTVPRARLPVLSMPEDFIGLYLRTHPDSDKAQSQVALLALKSAAMNDGTEYTDVVTPGTDAPLVADITVSGAGGLDTGARGASTWYEAYLIGKSSTYAKSDLRLMLHQAKNYALSSQQSVQNSSQPFRDVSGNTAIAQKFTAVFTGPREFIDAGIGSTATPPTGRFWLEIRADNAGVPAATVLATSDKLDASRTGSTQTTPTIRFPFRTPATLTSGTQYWVVMAGDFTINATNYLAVRYQNTGTNQMYKFDGASTWTAIANAQMYYVEWLTQNNTALTMPTGYDQKCKLGWFYNNSGNALAPVTFMNRSARPLGVGASTCSIALTPVPTLIAFSSVLPPIPVIVDGAGGSDTAGVYLGVAGVPDGFGAALVAPVQFGTQSISPSLQADAANPQSRLGRIRTEFQRLYVSINVAHNGQYWLQEWEW